MRSLTFSSCLLSLLIAPSPLLAQSITPAEDGTGTQVVQEGNIYTITGGTRSRENLFHSFERLGLSADEIATFLSQPNIENILGRVTGGDASLIDGLLQVTGGRSNLYLINPAGMVFGPNARLDLSGSFFATTATGIGFGENWFNAMGDNTYADLVGNPDSFAFVLAEGGAIANLAHLSVNPGESITLLGGTVTNTGTLSAPEGTITLAAVPGENRVRLSQTGSLLSLELDAANNTWDAGLNPVNLTPLSLPELLTGGNLVDAAHITVNPDGTVRLGGTNVPVQDGTTLVSGTLDAAGTAEAEINVLGDRTALLNATLNASGTNGGGTIRIGGDYQGNGSVFNASRTFVSPDSTIAADALGNGNGGRAIVWADDTTYFAGNISAQGGALSGNGGFAEVSGAQILTFQGTADLGAPQGSLGTLLLDPINLTIINGGGGANDVQLGAGVPVGDLAGQILAGEGAGLNYTISEVALETLAGATNVVLEATNNIVINPLTDGVLTFAPGTGTITLTADADNSGAGSFIMQDPSNTLQGLGRSLSIGGATITAGNIDVGDFGTNFTNGIGAGDVVVSATSGNLTVGNITTAADADFPGDNQVQGAGSVTLLAPVGSITTGDINSSASITGFFSGPGGTLQITARDAIQTGNIVTGSGGNGGGGPITITSTTSSITTGALQSFTAGELTTGTGGAINLTANRDITVQGGVTSEGADAGGGNITFLTTNGNIVIADALRSVGGTRRSGDIALTATNGNITTRSLTSAASGAQDGGNIAVTANNGTITTGDLNASSNAAGTIGGQIRLTSANGTLTPGAIATNANDILLEGSVLLNSDTLITNSATSGTIAVTGTVNGSHDLSIEAGTGAVRFSNAIGNTTALGNVTINSTGATQFSSTIHAASVQTNAGGTTQLQGNVTTTATNGQTYGDALTLVGDVSLIGDEIDLADVVSGTGNLTLQPWSVNQAIALGSTDNATDALDLTAQELELIQNGFSSVTIGRSDGTGAITFNPVTLNTPVTVTGGSTLAGPNQATTWSLTGNNTGTLTSGGSTISFVNIPGLLGNAGNDAFIFSADGSLNGTIDAGDGTDTLNYGAVTSPLTIQVAQLTGFENLVGGSTTTLVGSNIENTWTVTGTNVGNVNGLSFTNVPVLQGGNGNDRFTLESGAQVTGRILGGNGTDQLIGGGASNRATNDWIITGETTGTLNNSSFGEFEQLTGSQGEDRFQFTSDTAFRGDIDGLAGPLQLTGETVNLDGNILAQGDVLIAAEQEIRVGAIATTSTTGNGGNVTLDPRGDIQVGWINTEGGDNGIGGTVNITAGRFFRATDSFINRNGQLASISTAGGLGGGAITLRHGGNGVVPFRIGDDFGDNGSRGAITNGTHTFTVGESFSDSVTRGTAQILTDGEQGRLPPCTVDCNQLEEVDAPETAPPVEEASEILQLVTVLEAQERLQDLVQQVGIPPALLYINFVSPNIALPNDFTRREEIASQQITQHLGQPNLTKPPLLTTQPQDDDELELLLVLPQGEPIRYRVEGVTRAMVQQTRRQLLGEITAPNRLRSDRYRVPAQQLYQWLIAPLEATLEAEGIQNLVFILDRGVRSVPMAVLHDGEHFLIERYSIALMPSLSLTDTQYHDLRNVPVLAMGAAKFDQMIPLPAVPTELETVTAVVPNSVFYLNQDFTEANLLQSRYERPYSIVHLATHAEFLPGELDNSFIQFGDRRLSLDAIRQLRLNDPPVELLVLSACKTALGDEQAELGFGGMAVQAGVRSVLASLWYISDTGTLAFMNEFYRQLQEAPTRSEALRRTQLAMLRGEVQVEGDRLTSTEGSAVTLPPNLADTSINLTHPYFWAAFTMIGSPW